MVHVEIWNLLRCVLNIKRSEAASVRCIPKNALLPSTLENLVAPVSTWAISLRVGALWFSQMMALFKSFGSSHILNLPFAFLGYVRELTHGVGSVCLVMIPWCTMSPSSFSISSLYSMGTSMLYWKDGRVCFDVIFSWHVTYTVKAVGEQCLKIPGTVDGCRSRLHIDGVESWSFWCWTTWGLIFHWLCCLCFLRIWNYLTHLINRDHIDGVESGLFFPRILKWVNFWDPSSVILKEPAIYSLCEPGVLKESKCGSFLPLLVDSLESRLLPVFLWWV